MSDDGSVAVPEPTSADVEEVTEISGDKDGNVEDSTAKQDQIEAVGENSSSPHEPVETSTQPADTSLSSTADTSQSPTADTSQSLTADTSQSPTADISHGLPETSSVNHEVIDASSEDIIVEQTSTEGTDNAVQGESPLEESTGERPVDSPSHVSTMDGGPVVDSPSHVSSMDGGPVDSITDGLEEQEGAALEVGALEGTQRPLSSVVPLEDIIEEDEEEILVNREQLIQEVKDALADHNKLSALNTQLQHKIAEYLISRKKAEEQSDPGRTVTDHEKRYCQCMAALENLEFEVKEMQELFQQHDAELKVHRDHMLAQVQQANADFSAYKKEKCLTAVSSRSGKKLSAQEIDHYQSCEDKKEEGVIQVRLENIKLQNKITKLEALIKQKEQLAEGLHMIDFEQLKINNVDLNEKIEERNEDILKLRKKVTSTVQVLTHVKEKLQFLQTENAEKRSKLKDIDSVVSKRRDHLTRMKQARDSLRMDNIRLRQRGGLVAHSALLRDYEERKDQNEELLRRLEVLHQRHSELSVMCDGIRRKIEQARTVNTHNM